MDLELPDLGFFTVRTRITPEGCWEWLGGRTRAGYGRWRHIYVHRIVATLVHGDPPDGAHALHSCDNPPCINPVHLRWGTQAENNDDARARGRAVSGYAVRQARKTHCPQGHPYDEANTYVRGGHRSCRHCHRDRERSRRVSA